MNRRTFVRGSLATVTTAVVGTSVCAFGMDTHYLDQPVVRLSIGLTKPLRIVALGDIHFDPLYEEAYIQSVINSVNALNPDIVLFTGDFVSNDPSRMNDLSDLLLNTTSRFGSYATMGNHDHWMNAPFITASLESRGIRVLCNESIALPGQDGCYLAGLDSFWAGHPDPSIISKTPEDSRHIILVHEPDPFPQLSDPRIKLQISGHTHGGQIRLPLLGALHLPKWGRLYDLGTYTLNERFLYVNRGIGTLAPHARFDCRPEITTFDLY